MEPVISTRNEKCQEKIFLGEIAGSSLTSLHCDMAKKQAGTEPRIYLADWLEEFQIGPTEAAEIAGVTQGYISNIAAGRKDNINVLILLKLSEHMGVTVNDFYRPLPSRSQLNTLKDLSPKARAAILANERKKA
jgi:plasmid maintenance system antidote protein VapI